MKIERCEMSSFAVIGKEGSTLDGEGFISRLWEAANQGYSEVSALAAVDENGRPLGFWGAMSDFSRSFQPWENGFTQGLYLAGVQCELDTIAPEGWCKWIIPAYEYLYVENESSETFISMIDYIRQNDLSLAGAVHDFTCPQSGKNYLFFPIRKR